MAAKAPPPRKHRSGAEKRRAAAQRKAPRTKDGRVSTPPKVPSAAVPPTAPRPAPPSGAQKRQDAKAREQEARIANAHAAQLGQLPSIQDFDRLPPPPIGDPVQAIAWANDLVLLNLYQVVRHPERRRVPPTRRTQRPTVRRAQPQARATWSSLAPSSSTSAATAGATTQGW